MTQSSVTTMDLNADLGEGCAGDADLMPLIQRANIACGGHAGDGDSMRRAIGLALQHNVQVGAHPSYPDKSHFGRRETGASAAEIERFCREQLDVFASLAHECGTRISHVKPHGALYHRLMKDQEASQAFVRAVIHSVGACAVMGLPHSALQRETEAARLPYLTEMFADRRYEADGSLTPRQHPDALILHIEEAVAQVESVRTHAFLRARTGEALSLRADSVCVHGDGDHAIAMAKALHDMLHS